MILQILIDKYLLNQILSQQTFERGAKGQKVQVALHDKEAER